MSYEPIITPGRNFFLVSTEYKESSSAWCRKQIRATLRTCQGRVIIIDATGEYADLALEHDRLIREKIPSIIYRYKLVDGKPYIAHVIEGDTEANEAPHLIVYDSPVPLRPEFCQRTMTPITGIHRQYHVAKLCELQTIKSE